MKRIYNDFIPPRGYAALNFFGILFVRRGIIITDRILNHEKIHSAQMKEMLYIFFYIWYIAEWGIKLLKYKRVHTAYRAISFEREAYANDFNREYLKTRKRFAFIKYCRL